MVRRRCGTRKGLDISALIEGGDINVVEPLAPALGRVVANDVLAPDGKTVDVRRHMLDGIGRTAEDARRPMSWSYVADHVRDATVCVRRVTAATSA